MASSAGLQGVLVRLFLIEGVEGSPPLVVCSFACPPDPPVSTRPADPSPPDDIPPVDSPPDDIPPPPPDMVEIADISPIGVAMEPPIGADMLDPRGPIDVPNGLPSGFPGDVPIGAAPGAFRFLEGEVLGCG